MNLERLLSRLSPWEPVESLRLGLFLLLGGVILAVAWVGSANESTFGGQVLWTNVGTAGFGAAAYGLASWVLRSRSSLRSRRSVLLSGIADRSGPFAWAGDTRVEPAEGGEVAGLVVAHPTQGRFHRPGCPLVANRGWPKLEREAVVSDRLPCGVCRP